MSKNKSAIMEIPLAMESFAAADELIKRELKRNHINGQIVSETMLLFEALFHELVEQYDGQNTALTVKVQKTFGELDIVLGFEGRPFTRIEREADDLSPEAGILRAYKDKVGHRFIAGHNTIRIVVKRSYRDTLLPCFIGILLAILTYLPLGRYLSMESRLALEEQVVFPLIKLFADAMLMVGAPLTLFTLIKNLTDIYIVSERSSTGRKLQATTFITSVISVLLAVGVGVLLAVLLQSRGGYLAGESEFAGTATFAEIIESLMPSDIIEPFQTFMPFPMIVVALMITYASCSVGQHFDALRSAVDVGNMLFSKMLSVVMFTLPFFCYLAILTPLLAGGFEDLLLILGLFSLLLACLIVMFVFYLIRLRLGGVEIGPFLKKLPPLIRENMKINSAIDAAPFNIRYCARRYGFDRKRLSEQIPILAQTNLDGNCYFIMLFAMLFIFMLGIKVSWFQIVAIAVLVLFLSFGAANQSGSILVGTLIITLYLKADDLISIAIYFEVFFGVIQNVVNVVGDIVTVAVEEQKFRARPA